jgi:group I intron endonuclease
MNKSGIYVIKNIKNGKVYVGSAVNFNKRWETHMRNLNRNTHHSKKLQHAWNKYGRNSFEFCIIQYCEPIKKTLELNEQYWCDLLRAYEDGYSCRKKVNSNSGIKF